MILPCYPMGHYLPRTWGTIPTFGDSSTAGAQCACPTVDSRTDPFRCRIPSVRAVFLVLRGTVAIDAG
jgi:hypothetical protein